MGLATPGGPTPGVLVTWAGDLVAIIGEAGPDLALDAPCFVEFGLGPCEPTPGGQFFETFSDAIRWVEARCRELDRLRVVWPRPV
jgi:hypothetical protein